MKTAIEPSYVETAVEKVRGGSSYPAKDSIVIEEPLEIQLGYGPAEARQINPISVTMRTPGHDLELAVGFLMSEGVITDPADIQQLACEPNETGESATEQEWSETLPAYRLWRNIVRVELAPNVTVSIANLQRNVYTTSSCGICGKASLLALQATSPPTEEHVFNSRRGSLRASRPPATDARRF